MRVDRSRRSLPTLGVGGCLVVLALTLTGCSGKPDTDDLVTKLEQRNGLTAAEARCVADGLVKATDSATLHRIAAARTSAKLSQPDAAIVRKVIDVCLPEDVATPTSLVAP